LSVDTTDINTQRVHVAFLSAAGYASSSVLYNFGDPPFIHDVYAVAPFQVNIPRILWMVLADEGIQLNSSISSLQHTMAQFNY